MPVAPFMLWASRCASTTSLWAPGLAGDLAIFSLDELHYDAEQLVADTPGGYKRFTRPAGGYRATVVAGEPTQLDGQPTGNRPGRMLDAAAGPA